MWAEQRLSIVFVTHNVREAARLGQRVVLLGLTPRPGRRASGGSTSRSRAPSSRPGSATLAAEITRQLHQEISRHAA